MFPIYIYTQGTLRAPQELYNRPTMRLVSQQLLAMRLVISFVISFEISLALLAMRLVISFVISLLLVLGPGSVISLDD